MKAKTFQIITISLFVVTILFIIILLFIKKCPSCPVTTCPKQSKVKDLPLIVAKPTSVINSDQPRDVKVLTDPLYPPLNREDKVNSDIMNNNLNFYLPLNDINDEYRILGYLTSDGPPDKGGNNWQLFGRMKNRNQGDFYIIPANNNYNIKIPLTSDNMRGQRLTDLYSIPSELRFKSPMLNDEIYNFIELPKTDHTSRKYL